MLHWIILVTQWALWEWVYIYSCPPRLPLMFNVCFIHWFFDIFCFFTDSSSSSFYSCSLLIYMLQPVVFLGHNRLWGLYSLILLCISNSVRSDWDTIRPLQICWSGFMSEFSLFRSRISHTEFLFFSWCLYPLWGHREGAGTSSSCIWVKVWVTTSLHCPLWASGNVVPCLSVPWWFTKGVWAPLPAARTPFMFCPLWCLNLEPSASQSSPPTIDHLIRFPLGLSFSCSFIQLFPQPWPASRSQLLDTLPQQDTTPHHASL